jgi:hypothetical protein
MVESGYAASKFVQAKNLVFQVDEQVNLKFLTNLETSLALENLGEIVDEIKSPGGLNGLVFGRVDFVGSKGFNRSEVNSDSVLESVLTVSTAMKENSKELVVGGGVSKDSIPFLREVFKVQLDRFETRKVVFSGESILNPKIEDALLSAVHFELLWLLNKKDYYGYIHQEDDKRIEMLESRWNLLKNSK